MSSPFEINDDPEVDILRRGNTVEIFFDLRFRDLKLEELDVRCDSSSIYVYDRLSNNVVKIITLPFKMSKDIEKNIRNGIIIVIGRLV
jgi:HSP20 family molecular chaperone IbpA